MNALMGAQETTFKQVGFTDCTVYQHWDMSQQYCVDNNQGPQLHVGPSSPKSATQTKFFI